MRRARRLALGGVGYAQRLKMFDGLCSTIVHFSWMPLSLENIAQSRTYVKGAKTDTAA